MRTLSWEELMEYNFNQPFREALAIYSAEARVRLSRQGRFPCTLVYSVGTRFLKVAVESGSQKSVHSFIDLATGEIFKPASWRAPADTARGNILAGSGLSALAPTGHVRYL